MTFYALSTADNPFDPFTQFDQWYNYDTSKGYNSCSLLDRVAKTSDSLSDAENARMIELAIDEIVKYDPLGIRIKVKSKENEE